MKTELIVNGMMCEHCTSTVKTAIERISGVESAKVNLKKNTVKIKHDDSVNVDTLKKAVVDAGYEVE